MKASQRRIIGSVLITTMFSTTPWLPQAAWAEGMEPATTAEEVGAAGPDAGAPSAAEMAADFTIARPLMLATTVFGTALFLASLPVSLMGGNVEEAAQRLVVEPATYTFSPCLGCIPTAD